MNIEALATTRTTIKDNFGDLSDLSEELQNTIANIYYKAALIGQDPTKSVFSEGRAGLDKGVKDAIFYNNTAKVLPGMINAFREESIAKGNKSEIDFMTEIFLCKYKYRIEDALSMRYFALKAKKALSRGKVDEIRDLYKQL
jgi:hypothetical protein